MENYKVNLAAIDKEYNNNAFRYHINGFADACGMTDIDNIIPNSGNVLKESDDKNFKYKYKYHIASRMDYHEYDSFYGVGYKILKLYGRYDYLKFSFVNSKHINHNYNKENTYIRCIIKLEKEIGDYIYQLTILPASRINPLYKFIFVKVTKDYNDETEISFKKYCFSFDMILKLIKIYVSNPEFVYDKFKEKKDTKKSKVLNEIINEEVPKIKTLNRRNNNER